jgi:hypothetical protein
MQSRLALHPKNILFWAMREQGVDGHDMSKLAHGPIGKRPNCNKTGVIAPKLHWSINNGNQRKHTGMPDTTAQDC